MKKKHKKQLMKLLVSLILMLVVTVVGYFKNTLNNEVEQILAKPVRKTDSIGKLR